MSRESRAYLAAVLVGLVMGASGAAPALATPDEVATTCMDAYQDPISSFDKATAPYGVLRVYYSQSAYCGSAVKKERHKVTIKGGSGDGTTNECATDHGWLPNGTYPARYEVNHQTSNAVVKGSVWSLGNKTCSGGSVTRTELFIHSQGGNGGSWSDSNYKSEGCLKINQTDRTYLKGLWDAPIYGAANFSLVVR